MESVRGSDSWDDPPPSAGEAVDRRACRARMDLEHGAARDWRPSFEVGERSIVVRFRSYSGVGKETIFLDTDRYVPGAYEFTTSRTPEAEGPGGLVL